MERGYYSKDVAGCEEVSISPWQPSHSRRKGWGLGRSVRRVRSRERPTPPVIQLSQTYASERFNAPLFWEID
jgi:hypothetical protein